MKVIIINSKSGQEDLVNYGKNLLDKITKDHEVIVCDNVRPDFSNIPELKDGDEKLVLFNQFSVEGWWETFTKHLPDFKNIKYLLSPYSAYKGLDLDLVKSLGIKYRNNAGANAKSVAQHAIMCMWMLLGRYPQLGKLKDRPDGTVLGEELNGKEAGIIGMGFVGQELLNFLNNLKVPTVYYNRSNKDVKSKRVGFEQIFKQDLVFITVATNPDTKVLLSKVSYLVRQNNYLIDVSAIDDLYDKTAMCKLLDAGGLKGYAFETDNPGQYTGINDKNLLITPHMAWCTIDAETATVQKYLGRAIAILEGRAAEIDFVV